MAAVIGVVAFSALCGALAFLIDWVFPWRCPGCVQTVRGHGHAVGRLIVCRTCAEVRR